MTDKNEGQQPPEESELEKLIKEKMRLARKLGLLDGKVPKDGYQETKDYERLNEIDAQLWELV